MAATSAIPVPPQEFIDAIGGGDFQGIGQHLFELVRDYAGLRQDGHILDIGSGCGRLAVPLTRYLSGQYDGFDIALPMVEWCRENISRRFGNFRFHHASLRNSLYSKSGIDAADFEFPFSDNTFDVVAATSVFTHLVPASAIQYSKEIARVLKPKGLAFLTFYLLNEEYRKNRAAGYTNVVFDHVEKNYAVNDPQVPEAILAFDDTYTISMLRSAGLSINLISYGQWGNHAGRTFQDYIIAGKAGVKL